MNLEIEDAAALLTTATKRGDLAEAYGIIRRVRVQDLTDVALRSGFACIAASPRRDFLIHLQGQLAEAARRRTDGYGLREPTGNHSQ